MARNDDSSDRYEPGRAGVPEPDAGAAQPPVEPTAEYPAVAPVGGPPTQPALPPPPPDTPAGRGAGGFSRFPRGLFWLAASVALVLAIVVGVRSLGVWPGLSNPFADQRTDRSQPVLLKSIQDMSRFVAAEGNFEVIVDLENNTKNIPEFLVGERTLFVAAGTVEAYVDFGDIGEGAITESADGTSVEIKLPAPALGKPHIDNDRSYVYATQKGLLNRVGDLVKDDPNRMQDVYRLSEDKIAASANSSGLPERARENTRKMLDGMLRSLGYTSITVTFAAP